MTCFVDTSAMLAVIDASDALHARAAEGWTRLIESGVPLVSSSCVLVELIALAQSRLGMGAVRDIDRIVVPLLQVVWVDEQLHQRGMAALLTAGRRKLSYVDCVSFEIMRQHRIQECFAFDNHFTEQGFRNV